MKKKIFVSVMCLSFLASIFANPMLSFSDKMTGKNLTLESKKIELLKNSNNIYKYEVMRDKLLEENLNLYDIDQETKDILKHCMLNVETGLVGYIDKKFNNLSDLDKLKKQIELLLYLNENDMIVDSSALFIEGAYKEMQLSRFLKSEGLDGNLAKKENIIELATKIDNVFESTNFENRKDLVDYVNSIVNANLSDKEKLMLINDNNISEDMKERLIIDVENAKK